MTAARRHRAVRKARLAQIEAFRERIRAQRPAYEIICRGTERAEDPADGVRGSDVERGAMRLEDLAIPEAGVEYYQDRTTGWEWNGEDRWWELFIVWDGGMDGLQQLVCRQLWRWNGSPHVVRTEHVKLQPRELLALANRGVDLDLVEVAS